MTRASVAFAGASPLMLHHRGAMLLLMIPLYSLMLHRISPILLKERIAGHINIPLLRRRSPAASITTRRWSINIRQFRHPRNPEPRTDHSLAGRAARPRMLPLSRAMRVPLPGSRGHPIRRSRPIPGSRGLLIRRSSPTHRPIPPRLHCGSLPLLAARRGKLHGVYVSAKVA